MIEFTFEVLEDGPWALGHMTVTGSAGRVSTKDRTPDQSMMVFASAAGLLNTVRSLRLKPTVRASLFRAIDCSFELLFERKKTRRDGEQVIVGHRGAVGIVTFDELEIALRSAVETLFREHWAAIREDRAVRESVERSAHGFGIELPRDERGHRFTGP
jgi:hypothetical protein